MLKRTKYLVCFLIAALSISSTNASLALAASNSGAVTISSEYDYTEKTGVDKNNIKWSYSLLSDGTISIWKASNSDLKGEINIPEKLNGLTVSKIGGLSQCTKITSVKIPATVKSISDNAFFGCTSLGKIEIPSGLTDIGFCAFENTPWLTSQRKSNPLVVVNNILIDGKDATGNVVIPANVVTIGKGAFTVVSAENFNRYRYGNYNNITSVKIPEGVKEIGSSAFLGCVRLSNIQIPSSVSVIGSNAFSGTAWFNALRGSNQFITVNNTLIGVGTNLAGDVIIPSNVVNIGVEAFRGADKVTSVEIPRGVKEIGEDAFSGCSSLSKVIIPDSVVNIDDGAFDMCGELDNVKLPQNIKSIKTDVFQFCKSLTHIDIPAGVIEIGDRAFESCYALQKVRIPSSVKNISYDAYDGCGNLVAAYCDGNSYGSKYFKNKNISVKEYTKYSNDNSDIQAGTTGIATDENNIKWKYTQLSDGTLSISAVGQSVSRKIEIPSKLNGHAVSTIGTDALYDCKITSVTIPEGVKIISDRAFGSNAQLTSVEIPLSVTHIGASAFISCRGITSVIIPNKEVTLGEYAFPEITKVNIGSSNAASSGTQSPSGQANNQSNGSTLPQGWHKDGEHWNWLWGNGSKRNGWYEENGNWYYFYGSGEMATEFIDLNGYSYYFKTNSVDGKAAMVTGWQKINGNWFYFNPNSDGFKGLMKRACWAYIGGCWYYFYYDGTMAHDTYIEGYYVNSSGAWVK